MKLSASLARCEFEHRLVALWATGVTGGPNVGSGLAEAREGALNRAHEQVIASRQDGAAFWTSRSMTHSHRVDNRLTSDLPFVVGK
jgi:hypothetical protein